MKENDYMFSGHQRWMGI